MTETDETVSFNKGSARHSRLSPHGWPLNVLSDLFLLFYFCSLLFSATVLIYGRSGASGHYVLSVVGCGFINEDEKKRSRRSRRRRKKGGKETKLKRKKK